jgi:hypothetical protein
MSRWTLASCIAAALTCCAAACGSCEKDDAKKDEARSVRPRTGSAPVSPKRLESPKLDTRKLPKRTSPTKVTPEEAGETLPVPDGARVLSEPTASRGGPQTKSTLCFDDADVDQATASLKKSLIHGGWSDIQHGASGGRHDRVTMSAHKAPYRLSAQIMLGNWEECKRSQGQVYASLTLGKIANRPTGDAVSAPDDPAE